jgi:hypothetical protein
MAHLRRKKAEGNATEGDIVYHNRDWYLRTLEAFDLIVDRVEIERNRSRGQITLGSCEHRNYLAWCAMLEVVCSLVLFAEDPRYKFLRDGDIEKLHFPLSKWSRARIIKLRIENGHINVQTHF